MQATAKNQSTLVSGVNEIYGDGAIKFRKLLRSFENVLDERGFQQLIPGMLTHDSVFRNNIDFLGERFMDVLVYVKLDDEQDVVLLPEGTMRTYDFISRNNMDKAKIFYNEQFVRNETAKKVRLGTTRTFWQTGFEIFNYPFLEAGVEAIEIVSQMIRSAGIDDVVIRYSDKRLIESLLEESFDAKDQKILKDIIDEADDSPDRLLELYERKGGKNTSICCVADFIKLGNNGDLSLDKLSKLCGAQTYKEGINHIAQIQDKASKDVCLKVVPFMAKSWNAYDTLLFDARSPRYERALAGGGNLSLSYKRDKPKTGAGIGTTRIFQLLNQ